MPLPSEAGLLPLISAVLIASYPTNYLKASNASWTKVYELWKDLTLQVIRGYTHYDFENWTIPCLYVAGKYLRLFAMRADEERKTTEDTSMTVLQDDFDPEAEEHKWLEDCARHLNRIFQTCLNDRYLRSPMRFPLRDSLN